MDFRKTFDAEALYANYKVISADWLLSNGNGEMIRMDNVATVNGYGSVAVSGNNNSHVVAGGGRYRPASGANKVS